MAVTADLDRAHEQGETASRPNVTTAPPAVTDADACLADQLVGTWILSDVDRLPWSERRRQV